jgi:hypothetical protein
MASPGVETCVGASAGVPHARRVESWAPEKVGAIVDDSIPDASGHDLRI